MAGEDHAAMSMEEAIEASGNSVATEQSTEQQEVTTEAVTEEIVEAGEIIDTTASETQAEITPEASTEEVITEETETSKAGIIDLPTEETITNEVTSESLTPQTSTDFSEMLNGEFESEEDLGNYLETVHSQIEELEKANEPKFANDYVKQLNDYVQGGGKAADFARVQGVNVDNMTTVEKLVTQTTWNNPNLSQAKAKEYILNKYDLEDGDNGDENAQAIIDSNEASKQIRDLQAEDLTADRRGISEEEWQGRQAEIQQGNEVASQQANETRMNDWSPVIDTALDSLKNDGIVIDLGDGKGFRYEFDADDTYLSELADKVDEALFTSGSSAGENPELAKNMIKLQYQSDNLAKIVKSYGNAIANSTNEKNFRESNNPSVIARGDAIPQQGDALPTAEEAMRKVMGL